MMDSEIRLINLAKAQIANRTQSASSLRNSILKLIKLVERKDKENRVVPPPCYNEDLHHVSLVKGKGKFTIIVDKDGEVNIIDNSLEDWTNYVDSDTIYCNTITI